MSNYLNNKDTFQKKMNFYLRRFVVDAIMLSLLSPSRAVFMLCTFVRQVRAAGRRASQERQKLMIPPYMIISITDKCNLKCKGCYAQAHSTKRKEELSKVEWGNLFTQAGELGISITFVAGGEPLARPDFFDVTRAFKSMIFGVFTNGLLIDDSFIKIFREQQNVVPIISIDGLEDLTDIRRGDGVFKSIRAVISNLDKAEIFYGISITITRNNFEAVTNDRFLKSFIESGCGLFFFVEYVAIDDSSKGLVLTEEQRSALHVMTGSFRKRYRALFVEFPGDEQEYDGCLASGRGFLHIAVDGSLEPCPFAPYSDRNIRNYPLKDALFSPMLSKIRQNHNMLKETTGGCALWNNRKWLESLQKEDPAPAAESVKYRS